MPLIKFEVGKEEGFHLLVSSVEVGWFGDGVYGVTEHSLRQLDPCFREKGVRYRVLSQEEANRLVPRKKAKKS